jgi:hypothetical protein
MRKPAAEGVVAARSGTGGRDRRSGSRAMFMGLSGLDLYGRACESSGAGAALLNRSGMDNRCVGTLDRIAVLGATMQLSGAAIVSHRVQPDRSAELDRIELGRTRMRCAAACRRHPGGHAGVPGMPRRGGNC